MGFASQWSQYFPPKPTFTEKDVPPGSQQGNVFIITGANQGIGLELVKMLYPTGATIYLAGRSRERVEQAIKDVTESQKSESTPSILKYLHLDLNDLSTIKASAAAFAAQEKKLNILWNNAGIGVEAQGTTTKQNIKVQVGINCIAPLLFTQELLPQLQEAAKTATAGSVRVIWTGSLTIESFAPSQGLIYESLEKGKTTWPIVDYAMSKVGNWYLAVEAAQRWGKYGIVSVVQNPGNVLTNIYSSQPTLVMIILKTLLLYEPKMGGYTLLFSGFTPELDIEKNNGAYIRPWGVLAPCGRADLYKKIEQGAATEFWEWCEKQYQRHV
ncbi:NAD(P)-binding protein [Periconia macrospinosa]|uniref:NAD(P)-binding protein n=1 Tax=Periconia macrospinosa TaxID=97972 RepID=A0A2V1DQQ7_9PLEO|nr:NAD(P)-binding protein [Periconia macrospinosa]